MRLIDADAAIDMVLGLENCYNGFSDTYDKSCIIGLLDELPTVDAEPVRHGNWMRRTNELKHPSWYSCSECGGQFNYKWKFCPNCGAKMDEVEDDIS